MLPPRDVSQAGVFYRPYDPADSRLADPLWRYARAEEDEERLRREGRHTLADKANEQMLRCLDELSDHAGPLLQPTLLIPDGRDSSGDERWSDLGALTPDVVANWLFHTERRMLTPAQTELLHAHLRELARGRDGAPPSELLVAMLQDGLEQRDRSYLTTEEIRVYLHLIARGIPLGRQRVCQVCALVIGTVRARMFCNRCGKSPVRLTPKPWHQTILPAVRRPRVTHVTNGPSADGSRITISSSRPRPARTVYIGECQDCGERFEAEGARQKYCEACGSPAARTARYRKHRQAG